MSFLIVLKTSSSSTSSCARTPIMHITDGWKPSVVWDCDENIFIRTRGVHCGPRRNVRQERQPGKLCGVFAIDETRIGKRKFECGRLVEGSWVLGIIELGSKEFRLEICPGNSQSAATLLPLIQKHVELGSTIVTDKWAGYNCLKDNGYLHLTFNYSDNFVDPNTVAHTQNIECEWRPLKHRISRGGVHTRYLADHLWE